MHRTRSPAWCWHRGTACSLWTVGAEAGPVATMNGSMSKRPMKTPVPALRESRGRGRRTFPRARSHAGHDSLTAQHRGDQDRVSRAGLRHIFEDAPRRATSFGEPATSSGLASTLWRIADLAIERGRLDEAEAALQEAPTVLAPTQCVRWIAGTIERLAEVSSLRSNAETCRRTVGGMPRRRYAAGGDAVGLANIDDGCAASLRGR